LAILAISAHHIDNIIIVSVVSECSENIVMGINILILGDVSNLDQLDTRTR